MSRVLSFVLMTGFLFAITNPAIAQSTKVPKSSWYVAGGLGASFASDSDANLAGLPVSAHFDAGAIGSGAFGYEYLGVRAEGELLYNRNNVSTLSASGSTVSGSGNVSTIAFMANIYYDFNRESKWKPFIGGGIGYADVSINKLSATGFDIVDDNDGVFAFQFKAGIGYSLSDSMDGTFGYRFFGTTDGDFNDVTGTPFTADGLQNHILEVGLRYRF